MEQQFRTRGFIVLQPNWLAGRLSELQQQFKETVYNFPDFKPDASGVWGVRQDGILTNPASFHNPLSRRLRQCATREIAPIIIDLLNTHPRLGMQCVLAPMAYNPVARKSKDNARWWYKRSAFEPNSVVLKGFANLGSSTQVFTCAPGTHFVSASPKSKPIEVFRQLHPNAGTDLPRATDCGNRFDCDGRTIKIRVPPGTLVVYHTTMLLKLETSRAMDECTQHFKWVFGPYDPADGNIQGIPQPVQEFKQPTTKPSYYPSDFRNTKRSNALNRLKAFSLQFPETWLTIKKYGNVIAENEIGPRVPPVIKHSLFELGSMYPDYGLDEQLLYRMWRGPWTLGDGDLCPAMVLEAEVQLWDPEGKRYSAPQPFPNARYSAPRPLPNARYSAPRPLPNARYSAPRLLPNARYSAPRLEKDNAVNEKTPRDLLGLQQVDDIQPEPEDEFKDTENIARTPHKTTSIVVRKRRK